MARPCVPSPKSRQRRISLPGVFAEILPLRWAEFRYPSFSPFALEMMCFDLRKRVPHDVTLYLAQEPLAVQEAVDRELFRQYREGPERNGILVQAVCCQIAADARPAPAGSFASLRERVRYSEVLAPRIEIRWRELGYRNLSEYVTALVRYDFMLLGPHKYFSGDDTDPRYLARLDLATAAEFDSHEPKKPIFLARLIQEKAGRPLSEEERRARMRAHALKLIERSLAADRQERGKL